MAKYDAVCIQCGSWKRVALARCGDCHHVPVLDADKAKSVYLSLGVVCVLSQSENNYKFEGSYHDLVEARNTIKSGGTYEYEQQLLNEISVGLKDFEAIGWRFTAFAVCVIFTSLVACAVAIWLLLK